MRTVYLSSTFADLERYRWAVYRALRRAQYDVKAMEDYVARDDRMVDACLRDVSQADLYIGVVAHRYGFVPEDHNPEGLSITHLEYRKAREAKKPVLIFLLEPSAPWDDRFTDSKTGDNDAGARIAGFRADLERLASGRFREPADLVEKVLASVALEEAAMRRRALPQDLGSAESLTLMDSAIPEIRGKITQAISDADRPEVVTVNLGNGDRWWSTRLLLLAGLCRDYTDVQLFVFEHSDGRFLGTCSPRDVQRALAAAYPDTETAYRNSLPPAGEEAPDPVANVDYVLEGFSKAMDDLGREPDVKEWVAPHVVERWPGVRSSAVPIGAAGVTPDLLRRIAEHDAAFVVLTGEDRVTKVVNQADLRRLAQVALVGIDDR